MRLSEDDSYLFTSVNDVDQTQEQDLFTITKWVNQGKLDYNPYITKHALEVILSVKNKKSNHPELIFNVVPVARENCTKHLRCI